MGRGLFQSAWALLLCAALASCASKDAVSVSGSVGNVQLSVQKSTFVTALSGGFDVSLELGSRASSGTDLTMSAFTLVRADSGAAVLSKPLALVTTQRFPLHLDPGSTATVHFTVSDGSSTSAPVMEASQQDYPLVCNAGALRISGALQDSASGERLTPLDSAPFQPSCL